MPAVIKRVLPANEAPAHWPTDQDSIAVVPVPWPPAQTVPRGAMDCAPDSDVRRDALNKSERAGRLRTVREDGATKLGELPVRTKNTGTG